MSFRYDENYEDFSPMVDVVDEEVVEETVPEVEEPEPAHETLNLTGKVNCGRLNIRAEATTDSKAIERILKGHEVFILEEIGDWYKINTFVDGKDVDGYCVKSFISVD